MRGNPEEERVLKAKIDVGIATSLVIGPMNALALLEEEEDDEVVLTLQALDQMILMTEREDEEVDIEEAEKATEEEEGPTAAMTLTRANQETKRTRDERTEEEALVLMEVIEKTLTLKRDQKLARAKKADTQSSRTRTSPRRPQGLKALKNQRNQEQGAEVEVEIRARTEKEEVDLLQAHPINQTK